MTFVRFTGNPLLTRETIPGACPELVDVSSVFNPGAIRHQDEIHLLLRVQNRGRETYLLPAWSPDGLSFTVAEQPIELAGLDRVGKTVYHVYDPRITRIDDDYLICVAMDTDDGCHLGIARSDDLATFEFLGIASTEDTRNGVLFPERVEGRYLRLERPNRVRPPGGPSTGSTIVLSESTNLVDWNPVADVMQGRAHFWDEHIGSGPPPVKTRRGWLHVYHGVATHFASSNIYQTGAVLLDLEDPSKVIARTRYNILEPRETYELVGQVPNVVFPSGWAVDTDEEGFAIEDGEILLYYGAADTCIGLARCRVRDLLATLST